ncbi:MAG: glycosyltransferase family 2 protein [Candidatus Obscuribacterales bacterium]|nr:glycosyltransferase family 2 protein [Candidatus Obscuribacterales bacterium]
MASKTLSVIVPNYNDGDHIAFSLRAICEQSLPPNELIVVDDGSTDESIAIIRAVAEQYPFIRLLCNDQNRGIVYSANRAMKIVTGDYVYIASANDLVLPGFFEKSLDILSKHPEAGFCCSDAVCINTSENNSVTESRTGWSEFARYLAPSELAAITRSGKGLYHPITNTCILKRDFLPAEGLWEQRVGCYCDWLLHQALLFRHGCCFIPEPLAALRWTGTSMSHRVNTDMHAYREIMQELVAVLASPEYEDVAEMIVYSRSFKAFQLKAFTPAFSWRALRPHLRNRYAGHYLRHLLIEHLAFVARNAPNLLFDLQATFSKKRRRASKQEIRETLVSCKYYLQNVWDRTFAHSFHRYDRIRSFLLRQFRG